MIICGWEQKIKKTWLKAVTRPSKRVPQPVRTFSNQSIALGNEKDQGKEERLKGGPEPRGKIISMYRLKGEKMEVRLRGGQKKKKIGNGRGGRRTYRNQKGVARSKKRKKKPMEVTVKGKESEKREVTRRRAEVKTRQDRKWIPYRGESGQKWEKWIEGLLRLML